MKIMCQEHYDKVVQYAESIDDKTLHECLNGSNAGEQNPHHPCEIELYKDFAPLFVPFQRSVIPMGVWALSADWSIMAARIGRIVLSTGRFMAG